MPLIYIFKTLSI